MPSGDGSAADDHSRGTHNRPSPSTAAYGRRWAQTAWFLTGSLLSFGLVSSPIVGVIVVVLGVALTLFTARRVGPLGVGAAMIGISTAPILVGALSWGRSRATCDVTGPTCRQSGSAAAWLILGAVFAAAGLAMLVIEQRRKG